VPAVARNLRAILRRLDRSDITHRAMAHPVQARRAVTARWMPMLIPRRLTQRSPSRAIEVAAS